MLRGISDLRRVTITATDGDLGRVEDVCFDDRGWSVQYLVVDAGAWFPDRWALIPPVSVRTGATDPTVLRGTLTKTAIMVDAKAHLATGRRENPRQPDALEQAIRDRAPAGAAAHLQVATAAIGYTIQTEDGTIGHVKDILVDDEAWAIRYLLVDTTDRWVGKRVVVAPTWLAHVRWDEARTFFCIATAIWDGPTRGSTGVAARPKRRESERGVSCS